MAGLPADYIVRQVRDFATHARHAAWDTPEFRPSSSMTRVAESVADEDLAAAAAYFAAQPLRQPRARLIETERVPRTRVAGWLYVPMDGADDESLGSRIVELVRNFERHELRDPRAEYIAYVPVGSIERGRQLATANGGDRTIPCITCHGPGLRGGGVAPPIAGRSPTYVLRQLVAFRTGARATPAGQPMQEVVAHLDLDEMIALAAYVAASPP